jgi:ligand-binding sensor domain-containing protein
VKRQALLAFVACGRLGAQEVPLTFDRLSVDDGLSHSTVYAIHQDHRGFMWIGTLEGLNRHDGYGFEVYRHDPADPGSLAGDLVLAIAEDRDGDLWIGTFDGGIDRFDRARERFEHWRHDPAGGGLSHDFVRGLLVDRDGVLWAATDGGLDRFDRERRAFAQVGQDPPEPGGAPSRQVYALFEDGSGELWVGTGAGLLRLDRPSGTLERLRAPSGEVLLGSGTILAITRDGDGL